MLYAPQNNERKTSNKFAPSDGTDNRFHPKLTFEI